MPTSPAPVPTSRLVHGVEVAPRQPTLLDAVDREPAFDRSFARVRRHELAAGAWVDVVPRWVTAPDDLFQRIVDAAAWQAQTMRMYDDVVPCPRLTTAWAPGDLPGSLAVLRAMGAALSQRHRVALTRISANLYRDGHDSVALHGDRGARDVRAATVAVVSLGATRPFRLRQRGGEGRLDLAPASGDLLVMGGTCQRTWRHGVPKVADAGPRISVMFRPERW